MFHGCTLALALFEGCRIMHQFEFDVKLAANVAIKAKSKAEATKILKRMLDEFGQRVGLLAENPLEGLIDVDLYPDDSGGPLLVRINGNDVE
jgi:hypothetical protein